MRPKAKHASSVSFDVFFSQSVSVKMDGIYWIGSRSLDRRQT